MREEERNTTREDEKGNVIHGDGKCFAISQSGECTAMKKENPDCVDCSFFKTMKEHKKDVKKCEDRIMSVLTPAKRKEINKKYRNSYYKYKAKER